MEEDYGHWEKMYFLCQNFERKKQKPKDGPTFSVPSDLLSKYWTIAWSNNIFLQNIVKIRRK